MRIKLFQSLLLSTFIILTVAACSRSGGATHYWQRMDSSSGLYLRGPQAQQFLEQDIAECVHVIIELAKLASVREEMINFTDPLRNYDQVEAESAMSGLPRFDVPERIQDLRVDHTDFQDFEGCMESKGWRRVNYVHPDSARRSSTVYKRTQDISVRETKKRAVRGQSVETERPDQDFMKSR